MPADPLRVADVALAAAVRANADSVFIEPDGVSEGQYLITLERASVALTSTSIDAPLGEAVIARLAYLADLDLAAPHASSGVLSVRSGKRDAEVVITIRPGTNLRADLMIMPKARPRSARSRWSSLAPTTSSGTTRSRNSSEKAAWARSTRSSTSP